MPATATATEGRMKLADLSPREQDVLRGIRDDKTYPEIGHELGVSFETVKVYAARLRTKLGIRTKIGLALWAAKHIKEQ